MALFILDDLLTIMVSAYFLIADNIAAAVPSSINPRRRMRNASAELEVRGRSECAALRKGENQPGKLCDRHWPEWGVAIGRTTFADVSALTLRPAFRHPSSNHDHSV
jgi:hypothetical protein